MLRKFCLQKRFVSFREVFIRVDKATLVSSFLGMKTAPPCRLPKADQIVSVIKLKSVSERRPDSQRETSGGKRSGSFSHGEVLFSLSFLCKFTSTKNKARKVAHAYTPLGFDP